MNALDIAILSIIVISGVYSFFRGVIREVFSLLSLGFGMLLAVKFYPLAANQLESWIHNLMAKNVIGFMVIFIGVFLVFTVTGILIRRVFSLCKLGLLDRVLGGALGLVKGIVFGIVIVFVLILLLPKDPPLLCQSRLSFYLVSLGEIPLEIAPDTLTDRINSKKEALMDYWKSNPALLQGTIGQKVKRVAPKEKK